MGLLALVALLGFDAEAVLLGVALLLVDEGVAVGVLVLVVDEGCVVDELLFEAAGLLVDAVLAGGVAAARPGLAGDGVVLETVPGGIGAALASDGVVLLELAVLAALVD
ncbi:MAG: hypothetical protein FJ090_04080, partial [Deltaproteobacteria bacterium]|nr:hypothetical protein [Deltaproteobacteria bacterium]